MVPDRELLRRYVHEGSEPAFAELVRRHADLVYGSALRQLCGNRALAQEVTQTVFTALAARPAALLSHPHLSAWLHTTTRYIVSHTVRAERRRQDREQKAHTMHARLSAPDRSELPDIPPELIDEVLAQLDDADREAVLLRFFGGRSFPDLGAALGLSEDAARMRLTRALEKVRTLFARRGITSTAAAIGAALSAQAVAAPAPLAATLSTIALTAAIAPAALATTTVMTTTTKALLGLTATVAALSTGTAVYQQRSAEALHAEFAALTENHARLEASLRESEQRTKTATARADQAEFRLAELTRATASPMTAPAVARLAAPAQKSTPPLTDERRATLERMAKMKPLLEAGQPIKGAVVLLVGDKPVQRPVEFVIGRETRLEAGDDGMYSITPTLNADGSVKYAIVLRQAGSAGGEEKILSHPSVTQTPWGPFTISTGGGKVFAFDPDESAP